MALLALPRPAFAEPADFDFYVLALSWSPSFCAEPRNYDESQCAPGKRFAFVVHGLWPQYERGWPEYCTASGYLPNRLINQYLDILPAKNLIIHQWRKHGTCSGLGAPDYLAQTRDYFAKIRIPARYLSPTRNIEISPEILIADFVKTNAKLPPQALQITCGNRRGGRARLQELRVCMDKSGNFRACGQQNSQTCKADRLVLPPVR